ncbi:MAG: hemin uptake protein HemP [Gemmataceae bacterium]|nr:hemin uptake protein HemP [Gemmataceae bacterium]
MTDAKPVPDPDTGKPTDVPVVFDAAQLFRGKREIYIDFDGLRYRLRITRRGKLLLQK